MKLPIKAQIKQNQNDFNNENLTLTLTGEIKLDVQSSKNKTILYLKQFANIYLKYERKVQIKNI